MHDLFLYLLGGTLEAYSVKTPPPIQQPHDQEIAEEGAKSILHQKGNNVIEEAKHLGLVIFHLLKSVLRLIF